MSRRFRSRRLALQGLCCLDVQGPGAKDLVDDFISDSRDPARALAEARRMIEGVLAKMPACDELLKRHARNWQLSRLALVDRNILRLGAWELLEGRTPKNVVISQAMKLAGEFSSAKSPGFVNGVLDALAKDIGRDTGDENQPG